MERESFITNILNYLIPCFPLFNVYYISILEGAAVTNTMNKLENQFWFNTTTATTTTATITNTNTSSSCLTFIFGFSGNNLTLVGLLKEFPGMRCADNAGTRGEMFPPGLSCRDVADQTSLKLL